MCTVSWLRQAEGYVLLCNRDERHTRKPAGGPRVGNVRGVSFVAPVDGDHGGSWIGANQFGLTLCLLNRYGDWSPNPDKNYPSRGLLLTDLLDCRRSQHVSERLNDIELDRFQPFTMLALSVEEPAILIDWTGSECTIQLHAEARMPLTSSSLKDPNVRALRRKLFAEMVTSTPARLPRRGPRSQPRRTDLDVLHQFHRSHLPERGPYSVCMHRDDAATVSLSIVTVNRDTAEFSYQPNSPCLEATEERSYRAHGRSVASGGFMRIGKRILKRLAAWKWRILLVYLLLLAASYVVRWRNFGETIAPDVSTIMVPAISADQTTTQDIRLAYQEIRPDNNPNAAAVVLLQGSPGSSRDFSKLGPDLATQYRVIAPDLPGFGSSTHSIPNYSNRAHARYVLEMLDQLHIQRAHFVGYSMGSGVALHIADIAPERVASLTMLSGIGVQEMELLGNYQLNHGLHGAQLTALWFLHKGIPHFGWLDHSMLDLSYARNFYDTDQRPLREILSKYSGPMLIIHGEHDVMVPVEVAREDSRLVPQSELVLFPEESHFYVFTRPEPQAALAMDFFERADKGQARVRETADPQRIAAAAAPFNHVASIPKAMGPTALVLFGLLALATLISEDLTCIWAGVLAAEGRISFAFAAIACLFGIFIGDILLFLAGRLIGRTVLRHAPLKWFVREADVERSSAWFQRRGMIAIVLSRFLPGTRLPTYFAAGLLDTSFLKFTFYFLIAATVWTPLLVGASMLLGREVIESALMTQHLLLRLAITAVLIFIGVRLLIRISTFRGRRLLIARWRRLTRWEFWPPWAFYPPVVLYILYLGLKHRSLTLFTCANPAIEEGGFVGESKSAILRGLAQAPESQAFIASWALIEKSLSSGARVEHAREFMRDRALSFPVVLKPDAGERGSGVAVIRSDTEMDDYLRDSPKSHVIIQEHVTGLEFGVFYYRYPQEDRGHIFSITKKLFPFVIGDGESTLEKLVLKDDRAVCMARTYFDAQRDHLWDIPAKGESVQLIEIGTHCLGSIFLDGIEIKTPEMERAIDHLTRGFDGFYFGRFDIRTPSLTDFQQGKNFKVIELNGVTSEATSIYDPKNTLFAAYRILFNQWRIAFEIGAQNRARGVKPASVPRLARLIVEKWHKKGERSGADLRPIDIETDPASKFAEEV